MNNLFGYVVIPTENFERGFQLYYVITGGLIKRNENVSFPMAYFLDAENNNISHLFQLPKIKTSADGAIVYMKFADDLNETLVKIKKARER